LQPALATCLQGDLWRKKPKFFPAFEQTTDFNIFHQRLIGEAANLGYTISMKKHALVTCANPSQPRAPIHEKCDAFETLMRLTKGYIESTPTACLVSNSAVKEFSHRWIYTRICVQDPQPSTRCMLTTQRHLGATRREARQPLTIPVENFLLTLLTWVEPVQWG
jgi:hypothetical protein